MPSNVIIVVPPIELECICTIRWKIPLSTLRGSMVMVISPLSPAEMGLRENEALIHEQDVVAESITRGSVPLFVKENAWLKASLLRCMLPKLW